MKVNKLKKGSLISRLLSQKDKLKQKNKNLIKENKKLNNAFDELEEYIKFQRKISLSLNGYGVSLCDKFLDKLNELRNK